MTGNPTFNRMLPAHWELKRLKYVASINDDVLPEDTTPEFPLRYVDISNVDPVVGVFGEEDYEFDKAPSRARRLVRDGDTIVSTVRTYLRAVAPINNPPKNLIVSTGFAVVRPRSIDSRYLSYALRESGFIEDIVSRSVGVSYPAVRPSEVGEVQVPLPAVPEQRAIAAFLDRETAKLDGLIEKKRALIELLKEQRSALISRTVTRGLPPDAARAAGLDPSPPMGDSGVEWLGEIPASWNVGKFSREVHVAEGQVDPEVEPFSSMVLVAPNHIESNTGRLVQTESASDQGAISGKYLCRAGEVIYSKIRPALAKVAIAPEDCLCSADMYPMSSLGRLSNAFLYWVLLSQQFTAWSVLESDRVAMPKINRETLSELRLPIPSAREQEAIVALLSEETAKLDAMLAKVDEAIGRLREYRYALITAAVTGKIDVRQAVG